MPTRRRYSKRKQIKRRQRSKKLRGGRPNKKGQASITENEKESGSCLNCLNGRKKKKESK